MVQKEMTRYREPGAATANLRALMECVSDVGQPRPPIADGPLASAQRAAARCRGLNSGTQGQPGLARSRFVEQPVDRGRFASSRELHAKRRAGEQLRHGCEDLKVLLVRVLGDQDDEEVRDRVMIRCTKLNRRSRAYEQENR